MFWLRWDDVERVTRLGIQWLSLAADDPLACHAAWSDNPRQPYLLAAGRIFDVVVVEERVGLETFDQLRRRKLPLGPVMADWASRQIGFFLPTRSEKKFAKLVVHESARNNSPVPAYRYLSHGGHVVAPGPMMLSGDRYEWLRAPGKRSKQGYLRGSALAAMFVSASALLACADRYSEENQPAAEEQRAGEEVTHAG